MEITKEMALCYAKEFGLEIEVQKEMDSGLTPEQALYEWDCYPELYQIYFGIDTDPFMMSKKYDFKNWLETLLGRECPWVSCFFGCTEWENVLVNKKQHQAIIDQINSYYNNGWIRGGSWKKLES